MFSSVGEVEERAAQRPRWRGRFTRSTDTRGSGRRLQFLDACRGIAVLLVVLEHGAEPHWAAGTWFAGHVVQLGQMGVTVFFLCSGFIIPVSIERGTLRSFWIRRFFRLYPAFWVSLTCTYLLWHSGRMWIPPALTHHVAAGFAANATMMARVFGEPEAIGLYWTLSVELVFYVACTVLHARGLLQRSVELAYVVMAGTLALNLGLTAIDRPTKIIGFPFVAMFVGAVLHRWYAGDLTWRQTRPVLLAAAATVVLGLAPRLFRHDGPGTVGLGRFLPMVLAYLAAGAVFLLALRQSGRRWPRPLVGLGLISYSVYLFHPLLVPIVLPAARGPVPVLVLLLVSIGVSALTYRLIERPAIRIGHRLAARA